MNKKPYRLIIISAGDFAREVADMARSIPESDRDWSLAGFLDDRKNVLDAYPGEGPILGGCLDYVIQENDRFLCAIGDPSAKLRYAKMIEDRGGKFMNLISPLARIGSRTTIGQGCIICAGVEVTVDVLIGNHVTLLGYSVIGHDARVGAGCVLSAHTLVAGHAVLEEGVLMGGCSVVLPRAHVGAYAIIGAGSIALRKVRPRTTIYGNPPKEIFSR